MKIDKDNYTIIMDEKVVCVFDPITFAKEYDDGLSQAQKMAIGRMLKPYKEGKPLREEHYVTQPESLTEAGTEANQAEENGWSSQETIPLPWDAFKDCPKPGAAGDKTELLVRWVYKYQPKYYAKYYTHRKTCISVEQADQKDNWENKGAEFYNRGLKITDCPIGACTIEKEHFESGYKKYMISELENQELQS